MSINRRGNHRSERDSWRSLQLFLGYRIGIPALILVLYLFDLIPTNPQTSEQLFPLIAISLLAINLMLLPLSFFRLITFRSLVISTMLIDIIALTLLMHASAGLEGGLSLLILPSIAGASLLLPGNLAPAFAALGTLAIFFEIGLGFLQGRYTADTLTFGGIQGVLFFGVSVLAVKLARRAKASEALAHQRGQNLADMAEINSYIVEQMDEGIIVTNEAGRIQVCNDAAKRILGKTELNSGMRLATASVELQSAYKIWQKSRVNTEIVYSPDSADGADFELRFAQPVNGTGSLVFLQNISERGRKMQEIKLAALGRLTASIAHEIRNPLSSISHAGQLLSESEELGAADGRLVQIVTNNSKRMNDLVENILDLSRRENTQPIALELAPWLEDTLKDFREQYHLTAEQLQINLPSKSCANADPDQLHQVIWNLLRNAQSHAAPDDELSIKIDGGFSIKNQVAWLEIQDNGNGIDSEIEDQLFEPFFTTDDSGTGLGLYLSKELCEGNGGSLEYVRPDQGGSCFRIKLPLAA